MDLLLEKMKVHPKMESVLSHLEEEHGKGVATGRKFASERAIKIDDEDKITVMIILDKQIKCNPRGAVKCS